MIERRADSKSVHYSSVQERCPDHVSDYGRHDQDHCRGAEAQRAARSDLHLRLWRGRDWDCDGRRWADHSKVLRCLFQIQDASEVGH